MANVFVQDLCVSVLKSWHISTNGSSFKSEICFVLHVLSTELVEKFQVLFLGRAFVEDVLVGRKAIVICFLWLFSWFWMNCVSLLSSLEWNSERNRITCQSKGFTILPVHSMFL